MRANLVDEKAERGIHSYWRMYERMLQDNGTGWFVGSVLQALLLSSSWLECHLVVVSSC